MKRRIIAFVLVLAMLASLVPAVFAADGSPAGKGTGPVALQTGPNRAPGSSFAQNQGGTNQSALPGLTKYDNSGSPFAKTDAAQIYEDDDIVTFMVLTERAPLLSLYSVSDISAQTSSVKSHQKKQISEISSVQQKVESLLGKQEGFEMGYTYTIATSGFSVTTAYGNRQILENMKGVSEVYVAPTFDVPESGRETLKPMTNNASTMIGSETLNELGYTGKGMRIAILDTGLDVDHPSFQALSDSQLSDPLTAEAVEEIWKELNAGKSTSLLNLSYKSTKIPYVFNYVAKDFNVSNTYAGSDHGTHVAGIAAANKLDTTNVVGAAPDAQVLAMQVFSPDGGAGWDVIIAALEDCVRLNVDAVNLSLGMASGFTDAEGPMLGVMELFMNSDIQLLIAVGNDTNNAYGNAWGNNLSLLGNPDTGLPGTPSTYSAALSIASMDNDGFTQLYFTVGGQDFGYQDTAYTAATSFINNFQNQTLEFVMVPGYGTAADYEGLDVAGKVAVVSRGDNSFPEKQAAAQEAGAIACIVYNNAFGVINMQINDGEGNIPCISVTMAAGAYMAEQAAAGVNTLTVCDAQTKVFKVDRMVSEFSTWGVTPDLKLKPELSGVGGNIYSSVDPDLSGVEYGIMSGTSMATPQITGAMAVLKQYLMEKYPEYTGAELRKLAANLLMSTAVPAFASQDLEYSPRAQGAGLADLVNATTSPAYLSNPAASEGRPKIEFGDDPAKNGVYSFSFQIHNLTGKELTYQISASVITESISGAFIAGKPYGLEAEIQVEGGNRVTVPADGVATVNASIALTANDKAYLEQFPNGIYVEGFVYATPETSAEAEQAVKLVMPMVGFYGDWSDAPIFDSPDEDYSLYPLSIYTNFAQVGFNPYIRTGRAGDAYNAFSYSNPLAEVDVGLLRNVKTLRISATDKNTEEVYYEIEGSDIAKSYYYANYGMVYPFYVLTEEGELWNGLDADGNKLPDGTTATVRFEAWLDDGDDIMDDSFAFDITVDNQAPVITNADDFQSALRYDEATGHIYLRLDVLENLHIAAILFESPNGNIMSKAELVNVPGTELSAELDITGFGDTFTIIAADYACNEVSYEVSLDLTGMGSGGVQAQPLDKDRIYGSETYSQAAAEPGWFSANREDMSGIRNETFDSSNIYYSAEFVNGYLIGQNAASGDIELITPAGTYWETRTIIDNNTEIGDPGSKVIYDMALDHSGKYKDNLDPYNNQMIGDDALLGVGWYYAGDENNDGHDDGRSCLFQLKISNSNNYYTIEEIGEIQGVTAGFEMLTFGITTEGDMYGIATDGYLYSIEITGQMWNDIAVTATPIADTGISNITGGNPNVIQSMGYDHNTGTMYWYAHVQTLVGNAYNHFNMTYKVDLETAELTEVGSLGAGGQTALFVPNDLESDLFTMGVDPNSFGFGNIWDMTMVEGASQKLNVSWAPWNCEPGTLTWSSDDESIATVDQNGKITALQKGETTITATGTIWDVWGGEYIPELGRNEGAWAERTSSVTLTVVESQDEIYAFIVGDYANKDNDTTWVTYSDTSLKNLTQLGNPMITITDPASGETVTTAAIWQGGAYYQGYVYTVMQQSRLGEDGTIGSAAVLYRSKVTQGATPAETVIGEPEEVGYTIGIEVGNMGFDYNTGRMYGVDLRAGGLCIVDLDTGYVDSLGEFTGDIGGAAVATAMCVTADGTIVIADMDSTIYTVDPDTLYTTRLASAGFESWYYAGMTYDYNTGNIYWNPCHNAGQSPFYMILLQPDEYNPERLSAKLIEMGDVSSKDGVEQCVLFTIPENEPETKHIPVEGIEIDQGDRIVGLVGGAAQLNTTTTPLRPTVQTRTWSSSDESVVTVDRNGNLSYVGVGTATVTVSITNKDEATQGGPFTDTIQVEVLEAAGEFVAFLAEDYAGTSWYDFWLTINDYDLRHAIPGDSAISIYTLNVGTYFDGYFYGYDKSGNFLRIDAENPMDYKVLGNHGLDLYQDHITAMAFDYTTGTMYGLTLRSDYDYYDWSNKEQPAKLVSIDLNDGSLTEIATLDFDTPVYTLAVDGDGVLYAAGSNDLHEGTAHLYTVDKQTGEMSLLLDMPGVNIYTGPAYYGPSYNAQMTYDFGSDRLYINATSMRQNTSNGYHSGVIMVQLGEGTPTFANLGGISLYNGPDRETKYGQVYLGLMAFIPETSELPECPVVGVMASKSATTTYVGGTTSVAAKVQPSNVADGTLIWTSADESIATVDENGIITGVSVGTTTITATSRQDPTKMTTITVNVIDISGPQSVAYTISADKKAVMSFNPAMPGQTAQTLFSFDGAETIKGIALGDNCLYYVVDYYSTFYLYRMDLLTGLSSSLGSLVTFGEMDDIAYDKANNILYTVGGFYLFQYNLEGIDGTSSIWHSNYMMDQYTCKLSGVSVVDGAVYTVGTDMYDGVVRMARYSDKYLNDYTMLCTPDVAATAGDTEMDYDALSGKFYITDAGHNIYSMDMEGKCQYVDVLGDGIDLHGLAIDSTPRYRVTYTDGVDGQEIFPDRTILAAAGLATPTIADPVREGYTFTGWTPALAENVTEHIVYTATWTVNTYTVTLDASGGTVVPDSLDVTYGTAIGELPVPTKPGYTFLGWFDADGTKVLAETVYTLADDSTLTAQWSANAYTVILDANGGTVDPAEVHVEFGSPVNTLPVPVLDGHSFVGWFDADGNKYTAETVYAVAGDVTLTAAWAANEYTLTLTPGEGAQVDPAEITVTFGEAIGELPAPTKPGHTFAGWVDAEGNPVDADTVFTGLENMSLTATWTANSYIVTLDPGEGTVDKTTLSVTYGEAYGELPTPKREGYTFAGWLNAKGEKVTAESIYGEAGDSTLTASWTKNGGNATTGDGTHFELLLVVMTLTVGAAACLVLNRKKYY